MSFEIIILCGLILVGSSFELFVNDECVSSLTNSPGVCMEPLKCEHFKAHRHEINICSFNHRIPIICCPKSAVQQPLQQQATTKRPLQFGNSQLSHHLNNPSNNVQSNSPNNPLNNRFDGRISQKSKDKNFSVFSLTCNKSLQNVANTRT